MRHIEKELDRVTDSEARWVLETALSSETMKQRFGKPFFDLLVYMRTESEFPTGGTNQLWQLEGAMSLSVPTSAQVLRSYSSRKCMVVDAASGLRSAIRQQDCNFVGGRVAWSMVWNPPAGGELVHGRQRLPALGRDRKRTKA
jgi:hypothetical protein